MAIEATTGEQLGGALVAVARNVLTNEALRRGWVYGRRAPLGYGDGYVHYAVAPWRAWAGRGRCGERRREAGLVEDFSGAGAMALTLFGRDSGQDGAAGGVGLRIWHGGGDFHCLPPISALCGSIIRRPTAAQAPQPVASRTHAGLWLLSVQHRSRRCGIPHAPRRPLRRTAAFHPVPRRRSDAISRARRRGAAASAALAVISLSYSQGDRGAKRRKKELDSASWRLEYEMEAHWRAAADLVWLVLAGGSASRAASR